MVKLFFLCCFVFCPLAFGNNYDFLDSGDFVPQSQYELGGIGLIATPTARFSDDGEFGFGVSSASPFNRLYAKVQFFPWLEAVVRYTEGTMWPYNPGSQQTWKDKGIDAKFRLLKEGKFIPELALGLIDLGGTGSYASEFLVATKRFNNVDLSLGLGWGRLGNVDHINNPLDWFSSALETLGETTVGAGGRVRLGSFFTDQTVSVFGGLEYFTPIPNLSLKLEYDTNNYPEGNRLKLFGPQEGVLKLQSRINVGLNYRAELTERDFFDLSLGLIHGNALHVNLSLHSNLNFPGKPKIVIGAEKLNQPYLEPYSKLDPDWKKYLTDTIIWQLGHAGFATHKIVFNGNELQAEISQNRFQKPVQAIDLAARFLANNSPTNIDTITVINMDQGIETLRATIPREVLVNSVAKGSLDEELIEFNAVSPLDPEAIIKDNDYMYPHLYWDIRPHMLGTLQHQQRFYFWQIEALFSSVVSFKKGAYLTTEYGVNIANNFDTYSWHIPDGQLYNVRQNRRLYLTRGESGLRRMEFDYFIDLHPNVKALFSAGILEWMYGGIGGEVLYMPDDRHWALGLDAFWVKQRHYSQKFSFKDYEAVTGFLSFYYDLPFYDMRFKINAGKFLGKDTGVHIDVSRRFFTGARVGAIVALTNCKPECVGEGSFNKWIYFELPMELFSRQTSKRGSAGFSWAPLTKDAAQKVAGGGLYRFMTDATDEVDSLRKKPLSVKKIFSGFSLTPKKKI